MEHGARSHRKFSGSTARRWSKCHASITLSQQAPPQIETSAARMGTLDHELLQWALQTRTWDIGYLAGMPYDADPDVLIPIKRLNAVQSVLDYILNRLVDEPSLNMLVEAEVDFVSEFVKPEDAGGFVDIVLHNETVFEIIDAKFGVEDIRAENNPQVMFYMIAALDTLTNIPTYDRYVMTIIQPSGFGSPETTQWVTDLSEINEWFDSFEKAMRYAQAPNPAYHVSYETCHYCPAASICPALQDKTLDIADVGNVHALGVSDLPALDADADRVGRILEAAPVIREWLKAAEKTAFVMAMQGRQISGHKLVRQGSRRFYVNHLTPQQIAEGLAKLAPSGALKADDFLENANIGIGAAEELLIADARYVEDAKPRQRSELAEKVRQNMTEFTDKHEGQAFVLVPVSDRRPAENPVAKAVSGISMVPMA